MLAQAVRESAQAAGPDPVLDEIEDEEALLQAAIAASLEPA